MRRFIQYVLQVSCYFLGVPVGSNLHVLSAHVLYLFTTKVHVVPVSPVQCVYITWCVYITLNTGVTSGHTQYEKFKNTTSKSPWPIMLRPLWGSYTLIRNRMSAHGELSSRAAKQHLLCLLLVNYTTNWYILLLHHYVYAVLLESYDV